MVSLKDHTTDNAIELINWLISEKSNGVTGRLISAQWDNYKNIYKDYVDKDLHKLRRKID
jgi:hypothetical protein